MNITIQLNNNILEAVAKKMDFPNDQSGTPQVYADHIQSKIQSFIDPFITDAINEDPEVQTKRSELLTVVGQKIALAKSGSQN